MTCQSCYEILLQNIHTWTPTIEEVFKVILNWGKSKLDYLWLESNMSILSFFQLRNYVIETFELFAGATYNTLELTDCEKAFIFPNYIYLKLQSVDSFTGFCSFNYGRVSILVCTWLQSCQSARLVKIENGFSVAERFSVLNYNLSFTGGGFVSAYLNTISCFFSQVPCARIFLISCWMAFLWINKSAFSLQLHMLYVKHTMTHLWGFWTTYADSFQNRSTPREIHSKSESHSGAHLNFNRNVTQIRPPPDIL